MLTPEQASQLEELLRLRDQANNTQARSTVATSHAAAASRQVQDADGGELQDGDDQSIDSLMSEVLTNDAYPPSPLDRSRDNDDNVDKLGGTSAGGNGQDTAEDLAPLCKGVEGYKGDKYTPPWAPEAVVAVANNAKKQIPVPAGVRVTAFLIKQLLQLTNNEWSSIKWRVRQLYSMAGFENKTSITPWASIGEKTRKSLRDTLLKETEKLGRCVGHWAADHAFAMHVQDKKDDLRKAERKRLRDGTAEPPQQQQQPQRKKQKTTTRSQPSQPGPATDNAIDPLLRAGLLTSQAPGAVTTGGMSHGGVRTPLSASPRRGLLISTDTGGTNGNDRYYPASRHAQAAGAHLADRRDRRDSSRACDAQRSAKDGKLGRAQASSQQDGTQQDQSRQEEDRDFSRDRQLGRQQRGQSRRARRTLGAVTPRQQSATPRDRQPSRTSAIRYSTGEPASALSLDASCNSKDGSSQESCCSQECRPHCSNSHRRRERPAARTGRRHDRHSSAQDDRRQGFQQEDCEGADCEEARKGKGSLEEEVSPAERIRRWRSQSSGTPCPVDRR